MCQNIYVLVIHVHVDDYIYILIIKNCYREARENKSNMYMSVINDHAVIENYEGIEGYEVL